MGVLRTSLTLALLFCPVVPLGAGDKAPPGPMPGRIVRYELPATGGRSEYYSGYTPVGYDRTEPRALLVVVPPGRETGSAVLERFDLPTIDRKGIVVVIADACGTSRPRDAPVSAAAMLAVTVDHAQTVWRIDPARIFLAGIDRSAGAAALLAARDPGTFRALALLVPLRPGRDGLGAAPKKKPKPESLPATLVLSAPDKSAVEAAGEFAGALQRRGFRPLTVAAAGLSRKSVEPETMRLLEWFLRRKTVEEPAGEDDEEAEKGVVARIHGRTVARKGRRSDVVVVRGCYDNCEDVLDELSVPHTLVNWEKFLTLDLGEVATILVNCTTGSGEERVPKEAIRAIQKHVARGGYLFTTDWALRFVTERAFSRCVRVKDPGVENEETVGVQSGPVARNHPLLSNVFGYEYAAPRWMLDPMSWVMEVPRAASAMVLIRSEEMKTLYGTSAVATLFRPYPRGGCVLNVVSHFDQQDLGKDGEDSVAPMYQLIVNFINEAKRERAGR